MRSLGTPTPIANEQSISIRLTALAGVPMVRRGDDLISIILSALRCSGEQLRDGDILVIAQKIVSKAEGRQVSLATVTPSSRAEALAREVNKDPRLVELILAESTEIVRARRDVLVVAHRLGYVLANAGIDQSNIEHGHANEMALLLPRDPDATCAALRNALKIHSGTDVAVIINDSHGRAFRNGVVGVALGASGLAALTNLRGNPDLFFRSLRHTEVGTADEIASAASLLMGQGAEGRPIVLARGVAVSRSNGKATDLVRAKELDLFRAAASPPPAADHISVLFGRRSIRRYSDAHVSDQMLGELLRAATYAPSAHNRQPWRFAVVKGKGAKLRLAEAMGDRLRSDRTGDGDPPGLIEADVARSIRRIANAPIGVVVCMTMEDMDRYFDTARDSAERQMATQGTAMAMQNLLLAAHARGLGASIMCAPLFCPDTVRAILELPLQWEPQGLITLGWPGGAGKPFERRALADVMRIIDD
ncbi:MAG: coenzyme F420-0:L-glutamate ligase [Proteobacteria bacterium]|nr:coenzyme F420-0:L-glutamate ligase [Pseudomonadota bacterium]